MHSLQSVHLSNTFLRLLMGKLEQRGITGTAMLEASTIDDSVILRFERNGEAYPEPIPVNDAAGRGRFRTEAIEAAVNRIVAYYQAPPA